MKLVFRAKFRQGGYAQNSSENSTGNKYKKKEARKPLLINQPVAKLI
jgi:hypothetical protein